MWSKLDRRIDTSYYTPIRIKYITIYSNENYHFEVKKLKYLVDFTSRKSKATLVDKYIGMANIESDTGLYIPSIEDKGLGDCSVFQSGQVLFGKLRPYLNKVFYTYFDGGCTTEFLVLNSKDNAILSNRYLSIFLLLDCVVNQTKYMMTGNTLPRLQTNDVEDLLIPIPPFDIQQKIIKIMDNAYQEKLQKEQTARALIDSIDNYLVEKLGINLPNIKKKTTQLISCSELFHDRIDPYYYQQEFQDIYASIQKLEHCEIGQIAFVKGGKRIPKGKNFSHEKTSYKYFRVTDIDSKKNIYELKSIDEDLFSILKRYEIKDNNIILSNAGTIGKVQLFINPSKYRVILTENAVKIIVNVNSINNEYLSMVLNSSLLQKQMEREFIQTTIPKLSIDRIKKLLIPLPKIRVQEEIVQHITITKQEAKQLKTEAKFLLETAKKEVEKIILGDNNE